MDDPVSKTCIAYRRSIYIGRLFSGQELHSLHQHTWFFCTRKNEPCKRAGTGRAFGERAAQQASIRSLRPIFWYLRVSTRPKQKIRQNCQRKSRIAAEENSCIWGRTSEDVLSLRGIQLQFAFRWTKCSGKMSSTASGDAYWSEWRSASTYSL